MAGDTFDAGTVYAQARLDRDTFQRELKQLRADLAKFERQAVTIRPKFDNSEVQTGVEQARAWLKSLDGFTVRPAVELDNKRATEDAAAIRTLLRMLGQQTARPKVDPDITPAERKLAKIRKDLDDLRKQRGTFLGVDVDTSGIDRATSALFGFMRTASLAASATVLLGNSFFALSSIVVSLAQAAGGLGMILPAVLAAGGVAAATLKIGMTGVADALKAAASGDAEKLNEALAKLAPNARAFVLEMQKLSPAWRDMRLEVQDALFVGLAQTIGQLGRTYIPLLKTGLTDVAAELNIAAHRIADFLLQASSVASVRTIFENVRAVMKETRDVGASVVSIFLDLAAVGSEFLPGFADGFAGAAESAAKFISEARQSGQLKEWMSQGLSAIGDWLLLLRNVGSILWSVFSTANEVGGGFVNTLLTLTGELRTFLNSAQGQDFLVTFFTTLRSVIDTLMPGVRAVGGALIEAFATLAPHIPLLAKAFSDVAISLAPLIVMAAQFVATVLPPLLQGISAIAPAIGPIAAAVLAAYGAFKVMSTVVAIINGIRLAWLVLQLAFAASPIGLVITGIVLAIVGLVAGFMYLWNTSEGFRNFWIGLWEGIKSAVAAAGSFLQSVWDGIVAAVTAVGDAAVWLWQNAFVPAWEGIKAGAEAVGQAFSWLWQNILSPVFDFIATAAKILLAVLVTIVLTPIILAVKALGAIWDWLWSAAIKPAIDAIVAAAVWLWENGIKPAFDAIVGFIRGPLATAWNWLRDTVVAVWDAIVAGITAAWNWIRDTILVPIGNFLTGVFMVLWENLKIGVLAVWDAISAGITAVWGWIRDNIFTPIGNFLSGVLVPAFNAAKDGIVTAWNAIRDGLSTVWNWLKTNVFDPVVTFVRDTVVGAFNLAKDGIEKAWGAIKGIVSGPIKFMVELVYNEGIVPAWNFIAGIVGLDKLEPVKLGFATGGVVPGYAPGQDRVHAVLSPGEGILRPEATSVLGSDWVHQINRVAMRGGRTAVSRYVQQGGENARQFDKYRFAQGGVAPLAGQVASGQAFARREAGKPYIWGGVGPAGYDCSGFISAVANVVLGQNPHSRRFATGSFGPGKGAGGFAPGTGSSFVIGVSPDTGGGVGHMAGNLGGLGIESRGGDGVVVGGAARSPTAAMFPWQYYLPQAGGQFVNSGGGVDVWGEFMKLWQKVTDFMGRITEFMGTVWGSGAMGLLKSATGGLFTKAGEAIGIRAQTPDEQLPFDQGGVIPPGTTVVHNRTGRPELAGRLDQWRSLIDSGRVEGAMATTRAGGTLDARTLEVLAGTMIEIRDLLERRGAGATIVQEGVKNPVETARATALALRMS